MNSISTTQFIDLYRKNTSLVIIDVRTPVEFRSQSLAGTDNIPLDSLSCENLEQHLQVKNKANQPIYLLCKSGQRSKLAREKLARLNQPIVLIEGGIDALGQQLAIKSDPNAGLSLERQVRIAAGLLVLAGIILGTTLHAGAYLLAAFVGAGLVFAGLTNWCGMGLLLAKMPWNKA